MDAWIIAVIAVLAVVVLAVLEFRASAGVYGYLDVRSAQDADDVRRNIEEYGPDVPGLRLDLLPPAEREAVLAQRRRLKQSRGRQGHRRTPQRARHA